MGLRVNGYITVEASFIYPFIIFLFIGIVSFSVLVHDSELANILGDYEAVKKRQVLWSHYDCDEHAISVTKLAHHIAGYVIVEDTAKEKLHQTVEGYRERRSVGKALVPPSNADISQSVSSSVLVRWGHFVNDAMGEKE